MLKKVEQFIERKQLLEPSDRVLVALSGGSDSVALCHILHKLGYKISIAHCNFKLRADESDADEAFVRNWIKNLGIEAHFKSFDTLNYAKANKLSVEMAARDLRYNWFNTLCNTFGFTKIATGHHLNDAIETLFLNMTRGTGINGITGISAKNKLIIRPLLEISRDEIDAFITTEGLQFRHDSSNDSQQYMRNIIRQQVIPALKNINPAFEQVMCQNMQHFYQSAQINNEAKASIISTISEKSENRTMVSLNKLNTLPYRETILFEILSPLGFSYDTVNKLSQFNNVESGRLFYSETYQLLVDRDFLIIEPIKSMNETFLIESLDDFQKLNFGISGYLVAADLHRMTKIPTTGNFDAEKLMFPLVLRHWKSGDYFYPLGMKGQKKLSDFFTDLKIDRFTKDKIWILECNNQIAWVMGYRIDDRFKVTNHTQKLLILNIQL